MAGDNNLKALPTTVPVPVAPTDPSLEVNLPSFKYFTQVVQPLVFDDSLSLYEVTQKLSALLNANIAQVNALTGAVKEFIDYMVNWGTVLRQEWIDYQTELNKDWDDYQNNMNTWRQDLESRWAAYQANLNSQWNQFKTEWQNTWNTWKTNTETDILTWEADFEQTWNTWKNNIEATITSQVETWLNENGENTINTWLENHALADWVEVNLNQTNLETHNITAQIAQLKLYYSKTLQLVDIHINISMNLTSQTDAYLKIKTGINIIPNGYTVSARGIYTAINTLRYSLVGTQKVLGIYVPITANYENGQLVFNTGQIGSTLYTKDCYITGASTVTTEPITI